MGLLGGNGRGVRKAVALVGLGLVGVVLASCSVRSRRDSAVPGKEVTFDDACNLQPYFDERRAENLAPPKANDETLATNAKGQTIGEGNYVLSDNLARKRFAKLLREEYAGIPPKIIESVEGHDGPIILHVRWWDAGRIRRIRPDDDAVVITPRGEVELPPNMCVSDFLFGADVYAMRARYLKNEVNMATGKPMVAPDSSGSASATPSQAPPTPPAPPPAPSGSAN